MELYTMLNNLYLNTLINDIFTDYEIDSYAYCADKNHYNSYPKTVVYSFNSRGFRDDEWPEDLSNATWCVGDSFTVGMGQPYEEIWPSLVREMLSPQTFNVSLNGASNDWISRKCIEILKESNPKTIFVQWSYLHRREHTDSTLNDEDRRLHYVKNQLVDPMKDLRDFENFTKNVELLENEKKSTKIVHSFIPYFSDSIDNEKKIVNFLDSINAQYFNYIEPLDYARDGHHYDVKTATAYAKKYCSFING